MLQLSHRRGSMESMKIVIAPDSFKGSLTARQAADAIERGVRRVTPDVDIIPIPMADGGEGTVRALVDATGGRLILARVTGPLGEPVARHIWHPRRWHDGRHRDAEAADCTSSAPRPTRCTPPRAASAN